MIEEDVAITTRLHLHFKSWANRTFGRRARKMNIKCFKRVRDDCFTL